MNALDWTILMLLMFSALLAAAQGFFFEIISLGGAVGGYLLAAWGCGKLAPRFLPYVKSQSVAELAAFLMIFFAVIVLAGALARIIRWIVHEAGFRWADRALGAARPDKLAGKCGTDMARRTPRADERQTDSGVIWR